LYFWKTFYHLNLYLLAGLGADERIFRYLDLHKHHVVPIRWRAPVKNESIEEYAARVASQVDPTNSVLIGMSFGGIMAIEIAKLIPVQKVILISSAASHMEIPYIYRLAGRLRLHRMFTHPILKRSHRIMNWAMGETDPLRKTLLADMLRDSDERFLYWAMDKIVSWKNVTVPSNVVRIHGTHDRLLPLRRADYKIERGGHLSVANRAGEVSAAVNEIPVAIDNVSNDTPPK
jgi:pimeloyl-ACP methyl ester carboxylesterase